MTVRDIAGRAGRHLAWRVRRARTIVVDRFRRGDRTVIMTPPAGLRFGNWLYLWLDAHSRTASAEPTLVLEAPGMAPWLEAFPGLRRLTVTREQLRFHDRRDWGEHSWHQRFGEEFTRDEVQSFVREVLAPDLPSESAHELVVNIRRGDYYSDAGHRARYGFDLVGYVREALELVEDVENAIVVSDDPEWCRQHMDDELRHVASAVEYAAQDPIENFRIICSASRLIGSNSTFSYWGGYVSQALRPDALIVMPRFHGRLPSGSDAYQLDPDWAIIEGHEEIPDDADR